MMKTLALKYALIISLLCIIQESVSGQDTDSCQQDNTVRPDEKEQCLATAKRWVSQLWKTNDVYYGGRITLKEITKGVSPSWVKYSGFWTNEFLNTLPTVFKEKPEETQPWSYVTVEFRVCMSNINERCTFKFHDGKPASLHMIQNNFYCDPNVPTRRNGKPVYTTEVQARKKAEEYASSFGISNLWDNARFMLRSPSFTRGNWNFNLTPNINGYPSLYPIIISLADLPGLPLGRWVNCLNEIPNNPPTNVVLNAVQARTKADVYLKQYFPLKEIVPKLMFMTNSLEYVTPNYNYIRPDDETGFSKYIPPKDSIALAWRNYFKRPAGVGFSSFPVIIDVDAVTGEMLGGSD
jgi:hypothetical protein